MISKTRIYINLGLTTVIYIPLYLLLTHLFGGVSPELATAYLTGVITTLVGLAIQFTLARPDRP